MTALIIIGVVVGIILFFYLGYYLWSTSLEKYDYNIFNLGVVIRGLLSFFCLFVSLKMIDLADGSTLVWWITFVVLWLWTFIVTGIKTNFAIAFFATIYQVFAVFMVFSLLNKLSRALNNR